MESDCVTDERVQRQGTLKEKRDSNSEQSILKERKL